jgi:hypothetical protein
MELFYFTQEVPSHVASPVMDNFKRGELLRPRNGSERMEPDLVDHAEYIISENLFVFVSVLCRTYVRVSIQLTRPRTPPAINELGLSPQTKGAGFDLANIIVDVVCAWSVK